LYPSRGAYIIVVRGRLVFLIYESGAARTKLAKASRESPFSFTGVVVAGLGEAVLL
jgi:hypothetical protein